MSPLNPAAGGAMVANNNGLEFSSIEEQIQWEYDNKKQPMDESIAYTPKTREQALAMIAENGQNTRDTEVLSHSV